LDRVKRLLQQTLSDWQSWSDTSETSSSITTAPVVIEELRGGRTNRSFLVNAGPLQAVVRINAENSHNLGIDRHRESGILSLLQQTGRVPKIFFITNQVLVSEFIAGRRWTTDDIANNLNSEKISQLLNTIQTIRLPKDTKKRCYVDYCKHYIQQLPVSLQEEQTSVINALESVAREVDQSSWEPVISHHDLIPENLIETEQGLFLLDWEYSDYGHPAIDFVRLYGGGYSHPISGKVLLLQQGIDELWSTLQY
jgi:thiamine kinase